MRERGELEAVEERANVEAGPADDDRGAAAGADLRERRARIALVARHVVTLSRLRDVDEVMTHTRALFERRLRRPHVHAAVDLS